MAYFTGIWSKVHGPQVHQGLDPLEAMAEEPRAASPAPSHAPSHAASVASHVTHGGQSQAAAGPEQQGQGLAQVLVTSGLNVQPAIVTLATEEVQQGLVTLGLRMVPFLCCHCDPCVGVLINGIFLLKHRNLNAAPAFFKRAYDTQADFTWAFAGFNPIISSFFPEGHKTPEALHSLCAGC